VQATVVHQNADILRLAFSDGTEVTGTGRHRFWSETRRDWVAARELREGETLRTPSGVVRLQSATPSHTLTAVYNLEVEGAHEYFVGEGEVLVHNGGCKDPHNAARYQRLREELAEQEANPPSPIFNRGGRFGDLDNDRITGEVGHHMPQQAFNNQTGRARSDGPALGMTIADHELTRSFRGKGNATMRADRGLSARQRLYLDIRDVRSRFGNRYDTGIRELLAYFRTLPESRR